MKEAYLNDSFVPYGCNLLALVGAFLLSPADCMYGLA